MRIINYIASVYFLLLIAVPVILPRIQHPDFTETQLFYSNWPLYLMCILWAYAAIHFAEQGDKNHKL
jgi:hypothetical protein